MMENAGGEINLIVVLLIAWEITSLTTKPLTESRQRSEGRFKTKPRLSFIEYMSNTLVKLLLVIYGFFGFDYLIIVILGLGKYSKDP
jgi:hypothetical protein